MPEAPALASPQRSSRIARLERERFDLVVVGGGITGAGVARDAALRGFSVALLDAEDFAAGTSSRSSKLIHGGLRYLALGDVALVRNTALERKRVRALAPHLAEPAWMILPARSRAGLLKFRAALATYEKLGAVDAADRHRNYFDDELEDCEPLLRRDRFTCAARYREYLTDDARLVLANLRAAAAHGAEPVNYLRVEAIEREAGRAAVVCARCALSGQAVRVRGRAIVNATGPWVEAVRALDEPQAPPVLHLSLGIHVVVARARLPLRSTVILGTRDKRSVFAIPRGDCVYIGTTDTSYRRAASLWPGRPREDVDYLLEPVAESFAVEPIRAEHCLASWAGLRPLIAQPGRTAREISRRDEIWIGRSGLVSVAGGKLTGYRKMATAVMQKVAEVLGRSLPPAAHEDEPLPGGDFDGDLDALAAALVRESELAPACAGRLARLYGSEARSLLAKGSEPLVAGGWVLAGEIDWAIGAESAETLVDVLYRRTRAALYRPGECAALVEPVAARMGALLGWSAQRAGEEKTAARSRLSADRHFEERGETEQGEGRA